MSNGPVSKWQSNPLNISGNQCQIPVPIPARSSLTVAAIKQNIAIINDYGIINRCIQAFHLFYNKTKMKKPSEKNIIALGVIGLIVVMAGALALSLNGSSLQGYLRMSAPAIQRQPMNNNGIKPYKPQSPEPAPVGDNITRAEMAKALVENSKVPLNTAGGPHFSDVNPQDWYYQYVETAYNNFWIMGSPDGKFRPGDGVNRAEAAKFFDMSLLVGKSCAAAMPGPNYYNDVHQADWYYTYVKQLADCKMVDILPGATSNYYPATLLTRGRAQYMINNGHTAGLF